MKPALQIPYFLGKGRLHPKGCRLEPGVFTTGLG